MVTRTPRVLLALAALLSGLGGAMHALGFRHASPAFDASGLTTIYAGSAKALWLADSASLFLGAGIFGLIAWRPWAATRPVVILVALIPGATAALIYWFLGGFIAAHILLAIAMLALIAGAQFPGTGERNLREQMGAAR